jgi:non-structural maintenance of chromosomes element 1
VRAFAIESRDITSLFRVRVVYKIQNRAVCSSAHITRRRARITPHPTSLDMAAKKKSKLSPADEPEAPPRAAPVADTRRHCFIQALLARGYMELDEALALYRYVCGDHARYARIVLTFTVLSYREIVENFDATMRDFTAFWGAASRSLMILDLEIRTAKYDYDGKQYLAVVNNAQTDVTKLATRLSPEQIALFRVALDEILKTDDAATRGVDFMTAINYACTSSQEILTQGEKQGTQMTQLEKQTLTVARMNSKEREQTLLELVKDGWLGQIGAEARLVLGPRSFCELRAFILEQAPEGARERWDANL